MCILQWFPVFFGVTMYYVICVLGSGAALPRVTDRAVVTYAWESWQVLFFLKGCPLKSHDNWSVPWRHLDKHRERQRKRERDRERERERKREGEREKERERQRERERERGGGAVLGYTNGYWLKEKGSGKKKHCETLCGRSTFYPPPPTPTFTGHPSFLKQTHKTTSFKAPPRPKQRRGDII